MRILWQRILNKQALAAHAAALHSELSTELHSFVGEIVTAATAASAAVLSEIRAIHCAMPASIATAVAAAAVRQQGNASHRDYDALETIKPQETSTKQQNPAAIPVTTVLVNLQTSIPPVNSTSASQEESATGKVSEAAACNDHKYQEPGLTQAHITSKPEGSIRRRWRRRICRLKDDGQNIPTSPSSLHSTHKVHYPGSNDQDVASQDNCRGLDDRASAFTQSAPLLTSNGVLQQVLPGEEQEQQAALGLNARSERTKHSRILSQALQAAKRAISSRQEVAISKPNDSELHANAKKQVLTAVQPSMAEGREFNLSQYCPVAGVILHIKYLSPDVQIECLHTRLKLSLLVPERAVVVADEKGCFSILPSDWT